MYEVGKSILNLMLLISTVWIIYRVLGTFFEKRKWTVLSWLSWGILIVFRLLWNFGISTETEGFFWELSLL